MNSDHIHLDEGSGAVEKLNKEGEVLIYNLMMRISERGFNAENEELRIIVAKTATEKGCGFKNKLPLTDWVR